MGLFGAITLIEEFPCPTKTPRLFLDLFSCLLAKFKSDIIRPTPIPFDAYSRIHVVSPVFLGAHVETIDNYPLTLVFLDTTQTNTI